MNLNSINGQRLIVGTFFLACGIITWNDMKKNSTVPAPYRFIGAGMVYGILATITPFVGPAAALIGVGYCIVLMYQFFGANLTTEGATSVGGQAGAAIKALTPTTTTSTNGSPGASPTLPPTGIR